MTKKEEYDSSLYDLRTHVQVDEGDEIAIKPYYYLRNRLLHIRYTVDRCIELSDAEATGVKISLASTYDKQTALAKAWKFFTGNVKKPIIRDGVAEMERRIKEYETKCTERK